VEDGRVNLKELSVRPVVAAITRRATLCSSRFPAESRRRTARSQLTFPDSRPLLHSKKASALILVVKAQHALSIVENGGVVFALIERGRVRVDEGDDVLHSEVSVGPHDPMMLRFFRSSSDSKTPSRKTNLG